MGFTCSSPGRSTSDTVAECTVGAVNDTRRRSLTRWTNFAGELTPRKSLRIYLSDLYSKFVFHRRRCGLRHASPIRGAFIISMQMQRESFAVKFSAATPRRGIETSFSIICTAITRRINFNARAALARAGVPGCVTWERVLKNRSNFSLPRQTRSGYSRRSFSYRWKLSRPTKGAQIVRKGTCN